MVDLAGRTRAIRGDRKHPNFLIIGSGESGTSWLYACLLSHPQIFLPSEMRPEPHFFYKSWEYEKGLHYYLDRWFSDVPDQATAIGERSSSYIFGPCVPSRIAQHYPDIKLILLLREPIERAYSNWRFSVESGLEVLSFPTAIEREQARLVAETNPVWQEIQPFAYLGRGMYGEQVERFLHYFDREQLLILNSDRVRLNEAGALNTIQEFLGVERINNLHSEGNFPTAWVRNRRLQKWLRWRFGSEFDAAIEAARRPGARFESSKKLSMLLLDFNLQGKPQTLDRAVRLLMSQHLSDSNAVLSQYVDWDPDNWKGNA